MSKAKQRGGKRANSGPKIDPKRGKAKRHTTTLYDHEFEEVKRRYKKISKAVRAALDIPETPPPNSNHNL